MTCDRVAMLQLEICKFLAGDLDLLSWKPQELQKCRSKLVEINAVKKIYKKSKSDLK
jgi:hypothetical protein